MLLIAFKHSFSSSDTLNDSVPSEKVRGFEITNVSFSVETLHPITVFSSSGAIPRIIEGH